MSGDVHGILLLDKPFGLSSAAAVARAKRLFGARKAGHTGALDPLATGLLPVCFGEATKFGAQLLEADKTYRVTVRLGERTASADRETPVLERRDLPELGADALIAALEAFPRLYSQMPPMHSALKQGGKPLYEYARAGLVRERTARDIVIHELRFVSWGAPDVCFEIRCSKGAYIRVLAEDLAARLGTLGHLAALRRLRVAPFGTEPQWSFDALERLAADERSAALLPIDAALEGRPRLDLDAAASRAICRGQAVGMAGTPTQAPGEVRMYAEGLGFLGLGEIEAGGRLVPRRLISATP